MSIIKEFREFIARGNVIDLAVGVVIGAAFGKIVSSLVADLVMPPIGLLVGNIDFSHIKVVLREATDPAKPETAVTLNIGAFIKNVVDFLLVAAAIFAVVKASNRLKRPPPPAPAPPVSPEVQLLTEIRDALVKK